VLPNKDSPSSRIVSLLPAATEIVCALGLEECLLGRSVDCDFPVGITQLPVCSTSRLGPSLSSFEINAQVQSVLQQGLSPYVLLPDILSRLRPDIILTQADCETCAVSESEVQGAIAAVADLDAEIVRLNFEKLDDFWSNVLRIAQVCGVEDSGLALNSRLHSRIDEVRRISATLQKRPRVACLDWLDPVLLARHWIPDLIDSAGGIDLQKDFKTDERVSDWEMILQADPDVILVMACGYNLDRIADEFDSVSMREGWGRLSAVRNGLVYFIDGNQFFNRLGPRIVESVEIAAEILHPKLFHFGHQETFWVQAP
jgi:iron complex transport system substrate-binding protein